MIRFLGHLGPKVYEILEIAVLLKKKTEGDAWSQFKIYGEFFGYSRSKITETNNAEAELVDKARWTG